MIRRAQARRTIGAAVASVLVFAMLGTGTSGAATLLEFDVPVKVPTSKGFEPGIDIAADGTIFTNEPFGTPGHSVIYRSTNNGASFTPLAFPTPYNRLPGGGDSDVETSIGPKGEERVYFVDLWGGSYSIIISNDNGDTWSFGSPSTIHVTDRAWIESGGIEPLTGEQKVYLLTSTLVPVGTARLVFSRSIDGGKTWLFQRPVPGVPFAGNQSGQLVAEGDFIAYPYNAGGSRYVASSTDAGTNWTVVKVADSVSGSISSMARDASTGALHTVWQENDVLKGIRVSSSYDNGATWTASQEIWRGGRSLFPWIDARNGKVAVVWFSSDGYYEPPDSASPGKKWYAKYSESTDDGLTYSAPITVGGTGPTNAVKLGAICTAGVTCTADRDLGDFLQVALDAQGRSVVAYGSTLNIQGARAGMHVATQKTA